MQWSEAVKEHVSALPDLEKNPALMRRLFGLLDLTSLNQADTESTIATFMQGAHSVLGSVAAVCVAPRFVRLVASEFEHTAVHIASVANFPSGDNSLEDVLIEINGAIQDGANEIDVVFPYQRYLAGERQYAHTFVESCRAACGNDVLLKVILETGALADPAIIADASFDVLAAGADFIKTSTGKIAEGATLDAAATMLLVIKHASAQLKRPLGIKIAGGVREIRQAVSYLALAERIMGANWVTPETFRIGASQLAKELLQA